MTGNTTAPFDNSSVCLCALVRKVDRLLNRLYDEAIKSSGIATTQFSLLRNVESATSPPSLTDLATKLKMDRSTLSRNVGPLVRQGLIQIETGSDKRSRLVTLTPIGRDTIAQTVPLWESVQSSLEQSMGHGQRAIVIGELNRMIQILDLTSSGLAR